jgi:hypothetical protein
MISFILQFILISGDRIQILLGFFFKSNNLSSMGLMPVMLATWETEIRRITIWGQAGQNVQEINTINS